MLQCRIRGRLAMGASLCALVADTLSGCKTYEAALGTGASVTAIDSARLTQSGFLTNYAKLKSVVAMQGIECWRDTRLQQPEILLAPGVYDALSALMAEQAGFEAVYLSGASVAYTTLGRSDVGLTTFTEVNEKIVQMRDRISLPIIVDADTGFGNALNTERTVRGFERNGANIIQLEDQRYPFIISVKETNSNRVLVA